MIKRLSADVVGDPAGEQLPEAPHQGYAAATMAISPHRGAVGGEVERREAPRERVVEVVDQAGLVAGAQHRMLDGRAPEGGGETRRRSASRSAVCALLEGDVRGRVADEEDRQHQPGGGDQGRADPDHRARSVGRCERAAGEGGDRDAEVAGRLVQPEGEAAAGRPGEVDLHDDGHGPGEALVDAEQDVGRDDEAPRRREADEQRHRQRHEPAEHEQPLAADAVGERAGPEVGDGLREAEGDDEGQDRGGRVEAELALADERQHAALEPHHGADKGVERDEQAELRGVRAEPERRRQRCSPRRDGAPARFCATIASCSGGRGGVSWRSASANAAASS